MIWTKAQGNPPRSGGDSRKLVFLVDRDGMGWVGIRYYRQDLGLWFTGSQEESATVTHWMDLPDAPMELGPVGHCDVGAHCSYGSDRRCICLCEKCKMAKREDR